MCSKTLKFACGFGNGANGRSRFSTGQPRVECGDWSPLWESPYWPGRAACCREFHQSSSSRAHRRFGDSWRRAALCGSRSVRKSGERPVWSAATCRRFPDPHTAAIQRLAAGMSAACLQPSGHFPETGSKLPARGRHTIHKAATSRRTPERDSRFLISGSEVRSAG